MTCRCAERREALNRAHEAHLRGDTETVRREMQFVMKSSAEDAMSLIKRRNTGKENTK
jgi:hypothetical protein